MEGQYYDPTNPKYKCCCGCHVTTGTKIICWINIIFAALIVLSNIYFYPQPEIIGASVVYLIITALIVVTPLYGLRVENHKWLIPFLVITILAIIGLTLTFLLTLYRIFVENIREKPWGYPTDHTKNETLVYGFVILRGIFSIALQSWYFLIVYRCYEYLKMKRNGGSLPLHQ